MRSSKTARYTDPDSDYPPADALRTGGPRKGATPVLVTPVARLLYDFGSLLDTHGRYTQSMKALAAREQIALIDLNDRSMRWIRALGEEGARPCFCSCPNRTRPTAPFQRGRRTCGGLPGIARGGAAATRAAAGAGAGYRLRRGGGRAG